MGDNYDRLIDLYPSHNTYQASPERIWANGLGVYGEFAGFGGVEYIRADLAAPSAPAEVDGLVGRLRQGTTRIVRHYSSCTIEDVDDADETMAEAATALTALQAENERLRGERDALAVAVREIKEAWDWWREDSYDRCSSVVEDAVSAAHAKLKGEV